MPEQSGLFVRSAHAIKRCGMPRIGIIPSPELALDVRIAVALQACKPPAASRRNIPLVFGRRSPTTQPRSSKRSILAMALLICFSTPLTLRPVRSAISA